MDTAVVAVFHGVYHQQIYVSRPRILGGSRVGADDFGYAVLEKFRRRTR